MMKSLISSRCAPRVAVGVLALLAGSMAFAQQAQQMPQATVKAEREVTVIRGHRAGTSGRHMGQLITAMQRVDLSDLDLTSSADADTLRTRIDGAARNVCHELTARYPNGASDVPGYEHTNENCVRDAAADATERIAAAIAQDEVTVEEEQPLTMVEVSAFTNEVPTLQPIQPPNFIGDYTFDLFDHRE